MTHRAEDVEWVMEALERAVEDEDLRVSVRLPQRRDPARLVRLSALLTELREHLERQGGDVGGD